MLETEIFPYFERLSSPKSSQDVFAELATIMAGYGFTAVNYSYISPQEDGAPEVTCYETFGDEWGQYYADNGFEKDDYLIEELDRQNWQPFVHDADNLPDYVTADPAKMRVVKATVKFGWPRCLMVPLKAFNATERGAFTLATNMDSEAFYALLEAKKDFLIALCFFSHQHMHDLHDGFSNNALLTPQQKRVVDLMTKGHSNKEIAFHLNLSEPSVSFHLKGARERLDVRNNRELVTVYLAKTQS